MAWEVDQWRIINGLDNGNGNGHAARNGSSVAAASRDDEIVHVADYRRAQREEEEAIAASVAPPAPAASEKHSPSPASKNEDARGMVSPAPVVHTAAAPELAPPAAEPPRALAAVATPEPATTEELLDEMVTLLARVSDRIGAIELALAKPPVWKQVVAAFRTLRVR